MPHALIIEDEQPIAELVADKLQSLGHTSDIAGTFPEAEELLKATAYDYILLDLAIPVRFGGKADRQFGRNLLAQIRGPLGHDQTAVIVMTANDLDSYEVSTELLTVGGADNFVGKPFEGNDKLEKAIEVALKRRPPRRGTEVSAEAGERPPTAFECATIDFYDDCVLINGQKFAGGTNSTQMRKVLDRLLLKHTRGEKAPLKGSKIADDLGFINGEKTTNEAVRQIRKSACDKLRKHGNIVACGNDIVANDDRGYMFGPKIHVRVDGVDPSEKPISEFTAPQLKILRELRTDKSIARDVLGRRLSIGLKELDTELERLEAEGYVSRSGNGKARRLHLVTDPLSPASQQDSSGSQPTRSGSAARF